LGLHKELEAMVNFGMTPLQALRASVINGPAFFGKSNEYGAMKPGRMADMLLLDANPLDDITNTQKINAVILKGNYRSRSDLDKLGFMIKQRASGKN
jgi:imidazolonepropionase-like amidohydrolase